MRPKPVDENGNPIAREPKRKVACLIGYCGTGYHGMQLNPPHKTIEGDLFSAFVQAGAVSKYNADDPKKSGLIRAARTDKGVHAAGNLVSLKLNIEGEGLVERINSFLPEQIRLWAIERVNKTFDARKMCGSRVYEYLLPTYALVAPKPSSYLGGQIARQNELHEAKNAVDEDDLQFWKVYQGKLDECGFTMEELKEIQEFKNDLTKEEYEANPPIVQLVRRFKAVETDLKRSYRATKKKLDYLDRALQQYIGSHNFHNFTVQKNFKDPSAIRFMKTINVSDPFVIDNTEWVSIKIHGQSFMLHQIRKMIAMASLVVRTGCPVDRIPQVFENIKVNIPKAPALGLLLEQPVYEGYNQRLSDFGYNPVDFGKYQDQLDEFKRKFIYDKIYAEELKENTFNSFFNFIDTFANEGAFEFLSAKGVTSDAQPAKAAEIVVPGEKDVSID